GVPALAFVVVNDTTIDATAPPQAAGAVDITVVAPGGTSAFASGDQFTYTAASAPAISGVSPSSGSTVVTLTRTDFAGAGAVTFGGLPAASFTVDSGTSITAVAPPQAAGTVDVRVTTPTGISAVASADQFTYSAASAPSLTGVGPTSGGGAGGAVI